WVVLVFFFSSRRRHTRLVSDWSSDVCSSDLPMLRGIWRRPARRARSRTSAAQLGCSKFIGSVIPVSVRRPIMRKRLLQAATRRGSEERRVGKGGRVGGGAGS